MLRFFYALALGLLMSNQLYSQKVQVIDKFDKLESSYFNVEDDKIRVINFWATWCAPCVKELPYFDQIHEKFKDQNIEVILVSLDDPKKIESRVVPFLEKKNVQSKVIILGDPKANTWIDRVAIEWSGAIPATLLISKDNRAFYEQEFHSYNELEELIKTFSNLK